MVCAEDCVWFFNPALDCGEGDEYPAMVSASNGVAPLMLKCRHVDSLRLLTFSATDLPMDAVSGEGEISFVMAEAGGAFRVSRFSVDGAPNSLAKVMSLAVARGNAQQKSLKDYKL